MIELVNNNVKIDPKKLTNSFYKEMIEALKNKKQIAIVGPEGINSPKLRIIAEMLFLLTGEKQGHIEHFENFSETLEVGDIFGFLGCREDKRSCCIIWEWAQNFTPEAWSYAVYKTNDLEFKSIFLVNTSVEALTPIPLSAKSNIRFFCFNKFEMLMLQEALRERLEIERYGLNLSMNDLYRYGIGIKPGYLTFNTRHKETTESNNMIFKIASKEENNMKITGVYSNKKKGKTTIKFADGRVVSVQCDKEDKFDAHKGIAMALAKAAFGSKVLQECLSSYSEQKSGEENKKAKKARKEKALAKQEKILRRENK